MKKTPKDFLLTLFYLFIFLVIPACFFILPIVLSALDDPQGFVRKTIILAIVIIAVGVYFAVKKILPIFSPKHRFAEKCKTIILEYEQKTSVAIPSCCELVITNIKKSNDNFSNFDTESDANRVIRLACYNLICSGEYHLYRGELDSYGVSLMSVFEKSSDWLITHNFLTKEKHDDELELLRESIRYSG